MSVEENKAIVRDFVENHHLALMRGDEHDVPAYLAPDLIYHTAWMDSPEDHADTLHREGAAVANAFKNIDVTIDPVIGEGDYVSIHWSARAHHEGEFPHAAADVEPTGQQLEIGGMNLYRLADGKITEIWSYSNIWNAFQRGALA